MFGKVTRPGRSSEACPGLLVCEADNVVTVSPSVSDIPSQRGCMVQPASSGVGREISWEQIGMCRAITTTVL